MTVNARSRRPLNNASKTKSIDHSSFGAAADGARRQSGLQTGFTVIAAYVARWDPCPFILLNLLLSFQAAYAAPFIMMSQNRQQDIDRRDAARDYHINVKAELEIELLHQKIDALREQEVLQLTPAVAELTQLLRQSEQLQSPAAAPPL
jgi:uncharacterized membrane protein